ncbi:hypothetical protein HK099_003440, partial [Clydaea vesicula]
MESIILKLELLELETKKFNSQLKSLSYATKSLKTSVKIFETTNKRLFSNKKNSYQETISIYDQYFPDDGIKNSVVDQPLKEPATIKLADVNSTKPLAKLVDSSSESKAKITKTFKPADNSFKTIVKTKAASIKTQKNSIPVNYLTMAKAVIINNQQRNYDVTSQMIDKPNQKTTNATTIDIAKSKESTSLDIAKSSNESTTFSIPQRNASYDIKKLNLIPPKTYETSIFPERNSSKVTDNKLTEKNIKLSRKTLPTDTLIIDTSFD